MCLDLQMMSLNLSLQTTPSFQPKGRPPTPHKVPPPHPLYRSLLRHRLQKVQLTNQQPRSQKLTPDPPRPTRLTTGQPHRTHRRRSRESGPLLTWSATTNPRRLPCPFQHNIPGSRSLCPSERPPPQQPQHPTPLALMPSGQPWWAPRIPWTLAFHSSFTQDLPSMQIFHTPADRYEL